MHDRATDTTITRAERGLPRAQPLLGAVVSAHRPDRTNLAARASRNADSRADIHERVMPPCAHPPRAEAPVEIDGFAIGGGPAENGPAEDPPDVRVRERDPLTERETHHRGGVVRTDARERVQRERVVRQPARVEARDAMQVPRAPVVSESRPLAEHRAERRTRQRPEAGEPREEMPVRGENARNLGLLEHDFAHQDAVRVAGLTPGKVAAGSSVPGQNEPAQRRLKRRGGVQFRAQNSTPG